MSGSWIDEKERGQYMKRYAFLLTAVLAATMCLMACGQENTAASQATKQEETRVIVDTVNRKVAIKKNVEKIIAIPWPWSSFIFAIDGKADRISTMSSTALASYRKSMFQKLAPGLEKANTNFMDDQNKDGGVFGTPNAEEIAKINPSFVLIYEREMNTLLPVLDAIKMPTVVIQYGGIQEMQVGLLLLGDILGEHAKKNAKTIVNWHAETDRFIKERLKDLPMRKRPKVLHLYNGNLRVAARKYDDIMVQTAGGINVATAEGVQLGENSQASFEQILAWDPDIILLGNFADHTPEDIYANKMDGKNWQQLKAVKNKRVYKIPMGIYRWDAPNTEAHLFLLWLAKLQHPEIFADVSLQQHTETFYKTLFNHTITPEEMALIYHADLNARSTEVK